MSTEPEVLLDKRDGLGLITLNRPKAINALNHSMALTILAALREWADDDTVHAVVMTGAGERGLCAGGDIVAIYHDAKDSAGGAASPSGRFWRHEYMLNAFISRYPKPYVVLMDGIVMGGGVGLSGHGSHRIVTERSKVGMPETGIGFVPDVGGTYLLSRSPGEIGTHVALTTARIFAGDAIAAGFADYFVPSQQIPELLDALRSVEPEAAITKFAETAPASQLLEHRDWIDTCYAADTVEEIVARLQAHSRPEARQAAIDIVSKSPVALKVTLASLRAARDLDTLEQVLNQEYRVSVAALRSHDLVEGIRAQVVDKDRNPQWNPSTFDAVTTGQVENYFTSLGTDELKLVAPEGHR